MARTLEVVSPLPAPAHDALIQLGRRLRAHRVQQGWTVADIAGRLFCSPTTWRALESGKPGTSVGLLVHALWLFGQTDSLDAVAPAPAELAVNRRVRGRSGQSLPGVISEAERDF